MKLAVVTVTFNSGSVLEDFLRCCHEQTFKEFVLVVVDNDSKDNSLALARAYEGRFNLKVIAVAENAGVAEGNNIGIRYGLENTCEHVLILNNDVVFGPSFFGDLISHMNMRPDVSVLVPKVNYHSPSNMIWYGGGKFVFGFGPVAWHLNDGKFDDEVPAQQPFLVTYAPTCAMLVRSEVFGRVGMMDKKYFVYWDDGDFCYRLYVAGEKMLYEPSIMLLHKVSSLTGGGKSTFSIKMYCRNQVYFVRKHFGAMRRFYYYLTILGMALLRWVRRKDTWDEFLLRIRSFRLGFSIPLE